MENLRHLQALLKTQVAQFQVQPQLLLLPELFHVPYGLDGSAAWARAEPLVEARSPALRHMRRWAEDLGCFVGGSLLEAASDGTPSDSQAQRRWPRRPADRAPLLIPPPGHVYNSFVMYDPRGRRLDRVVRKAYPASFEGASRRPRSPPLQRG